MPVLYLATSPAPPMPGTDAVFQEIASLRDAFGGELLHLYPLKKPGRRYPWRLYGLHNLPKIRWLEGQTSVTHVFSPIPYYFPLFRFLRNPIIYTVVASPRSMAIPPKIEDMRHLRQVVVSNQRDAETLAAWGLDNVAVIPPGIVASPGRWEWRPPGDDFTLLMASAPWTLEQFDLKGIDVLLQAAAKLPFLKLVLLWRGLFKRELQERIRRIGVTDRVEIIDRKVDAHHYLRNAHAAILLSKDSRIVKAFPHSLVEALMADRPVIVSDCLPIADYVRQNRCGVVAESVTVDGLTNAIERLRRDYDRLRPSALMGPDDFSVHAMIERHRTVYAL